MTTNNKKFFSIKKINLVLLLITLGCQSTDVTIGPIKLWEAIMLLILPCITVNQKIFKISLFFLALILVPGLIYSAFSVDHFTYYSLLKSKYILIIVRGVELFLCFSIIFLMYFNKSIRFKYERKVIINKFLFYNYVICLLIFLIYLLSIYSGKELLVSYDEGRLKGFFVEGGPYGLYCSFLGLLSLYNKKKLYLIVFFMSILFARSKAGGVCFILGAVVYYSYYIPILRNVFDANKIYFVIGVVFFMVLGCWGVYIFANNYVVNYVNYSNTLGSHMSDSSFVYGRVAASQIAPNIISRHPFFGVGIGDYSLVRNNIYYRGSFPSVSGWDLTGLGGIFNLLIENGVFGLVVFYIFWVKIFFSKSSSRGNKYLAYVFILPFLLGVQLYFPYPWVVLGFLGYSEKNANDI